MNLIKIGARYISLRYLIHAEPSKPDGSLMLHLEQSDAIELVGQDADAMRSILDRCSADASQAPATTAAIGVDSLTGLPPDP